MNTVLRDWFIVSVFDASYIIKNVLWGYVIYDASCRYSKGDIVCTSNIIHINKINKLITTQSGSLYQILDKGRCSKVYYEEFELLRNGFSPLHIEALRMSAMSKTH